MNSQKSPSTPPPDVPTVSQDYTLEFPSPPFLVPALEFFRAWCGNPNKEKGEGFYYRLVRRPTDKRSCLQLILYYRVQRLPYHLNDFAPLFIYFEPDGQVSHIAYDSFHHGAAMIIAPQVFSFTVFAPWHAFKYDRQGWLAAPMQTTYHALHDSVILQWWFLPGKPQLKLRSKLVDPWRVRLREQGSGSRPTFRDEGKCPVCDCTVQMDTMQINGSVFSEACRCSQGHRFMVCYDSRQQAVESYRL